MSASVSLAMTHLAEVDENKVTPGVLGFIVFAVMALAVWGLMRSMSKHMGQVRFEEQGAAASGEEDGTEAPGRVTPKAQRG